MSRAEPTPELCGILLHPAGHTLSPVIHETAYRLLGLAARFEVFDVPAQALESAWRALCARSFRQLAVSIPHKQAVIALADRLSPAVRAIGAANTLTRESDGIAADNTDWIGVRHTLERRGSWRGKHALVVGAGGAARAVLYALAQLGCGAAVVNRNAARGAALAAEFGARPGRLDEPYDLLVQTTPVGMQPNVDATPVPREHLRPGALVMDAVYAPLETRLLREAREAGCATQDGLDWLVLQAIEQFRLWSGRTLDSAPLRAAAETALAARSNPPLSLSDAGPDPSSRRR
jgi:shikimate dehydrogenase